MQIEELKQKKAAIVGMGKNHKSLADFLRRQGVDFEVIDGWKNPDDLVGKLDGFNLIFRTPGLPYISAAIQQAKKSGVEIYSQTKLFFDLCKAPIIGITGTKGKGTTSSLIAQILGSTNKKTWLGGNIGTDPFEFLEKIQPEDFVVLELSSFQLQDMEKSPHIAVVLSVTADHLNHHRDFEEYIRAKSNILAHQSSADFAILHPDLPEWFKNSGEASKIIIDAKSAKHFQRKLLGEHNLDNIAAAAAVAKIVGVEEAAIKKAIVEFEPLAHRLQIIREHLDITYIDDSFSTNIEPAIAAIDAVGSELVLIVGGSEKGLDFTKLGKKIINSSKVKGIVVIGAVADKILNLLSDFPGRILTGAKNMDEILSQAQSLAKPGQAILFSPATASFDMFKNEFDRGEQFTKAVAELK